MIWHFRSPTHPSNFIYQNQRTNFYKLLLILRVQVHQLSTYKELDKEFFKEKAFQFLVIMVFR